MNAVAEYRAVQRTSADDAVTRHADLVRRIAHHMAARLPASVEVDDLIQAGMIGLIEASRSYEAAFFLAEGWAQRRFWIQAMELVRWFPIIIETARRCQPGSGFLLSFKGSEPNRIYPPES